MALIKGLVADDEWLGGLVYGKSKPESEIGERVESCHERNCKIFYAFPDTFTVSLSLCLTEF